MTLRCAAGLQEQRERHAPWMSRASAPVWPDGLRRCLRLLRDEDEALDACQDVFVRLLEPGTSDRAPVEPPLPDRHQPLPEPDPRPPARAGHDRRRPLLASLRPRTGGGRGAAAARPAVRPAARVHPDDRRPALRGRPDARGGRRGGRAFGVGREAAAAKAAARRWWRSVEPSGLEARRHTGMIRTSDTSRTCSRALPAWRASRAGAGYVSGAASRIRSCASGSRRWRVRRADRARLSARWLAGAIRQRLADAAPSCRAAAGLFRGACPLASEPRSLLLLPAGLLASPRPRRTARTGTAPAERVKGLRPVSADLSAHATAGSETLADGAIARPGDLLRVGYSAVGRRYGVILSIDGRGVVTLAPAGDRRHAAGPAGGRGRAARPRRTSSTMRRRGSASTSSPRTQPFTVERSSTRRAVPAHDDRRSAAGSAAAAGAVSTRRRFCSRKRSAVNELDCRIASRALGSRLLADRPRPRRRRVQRFTLIIGANWAGPTGRTSDTR